MSRQHGKITLKQFLDELNAFVDEQRKLISTDCSSFPTDYAARDIRHTRVQNGDFQFFFYTYFPHYINAQEPSVFHQWVFDKLPGYIDAEKGYKINISAPRGEAKSTLVTQVFVLWCVVTSRKHFIPIVMDSGDQAKMMLEAIKVELTDNPRLLMDFPDETGRGKVWNAGIALTTKGIKLQAFGSGKRMRGIRHGAYRPDLVILDDIENDENVQQKEQRDKLQRWLQKVVMPLGPPDGSMDIVYLNTLLHYDSVANRTHRSPLWKSVKFKSIIEWPDRMDLWEKWEEVYLNEGEEPADLYYNTRRAEMDAGAVVSWPSMRPLLMLMQIRADDHHAFGSEYQNEPGSDDDAPFKDLQYWVHPCRDWIFYGVDDPSLGKRNRKRDPCAILVGGFDRAHGILDVVEAVVARMLPSLQISTIMRLQKEYQCLAWAIETVQFQEFFKDQLVEQSRQQGIPVPARGVTPSDDKDLRIMSIQPHVANGTIRSHRGHSAFNEQLIYYPEADHDDAPDALQMLFMLAFSGIGGIPRIRSGRRKQTMNHGHEH